MNTSPGAEVVNLAWQEGNIADPEAASAQPRQHAIRDSAATAAEARRRADELGWSFEPAPDFNRLEPALSADIGFRQARRMRILPAYVEGDRMIIWVHSDISWESWIEVQAEFGLHLLPVVISEHDFNRALQRAFERGSAAQDAVEDLGEAIDLQTASAGLPEDLLDSQDDAPIIRLLNAVLTQAIEEGASDVHVEPLEARLVIRYRVDGILRDVVEPPATLASRMAARIKVMARLNIAERRVPQDGRISLRLAGRLIDIRVSTLPTYYGERVVMRILEKDQGPLSLEQIGMSAETSARLVQLIRSPHGIFLVTGPTGSGKTTTLYAALQQVRNPGVNIITIEDPVEYDLEGVGQTPVNNKTGMTFARGLRAILRQDPDVIMVGEIRDLETAEVAVQASLTGHLVFSTLHTNDAVGSVNRLMDMGVEPYLVSSSLLGVMAQRLVRKLCTECRVQHEADEGEQRLLGLSDNPAATIYYPGGCSKCAWTGYRGRTGIYELVVVTDEIQHLIHDRKGEQSLRKLAHESGMRSLREDGLAKVMAGITSLEEVLRVTQS